MNKLEKNISYTFKDISHLTVALTHSSMINFANNERYEFLGDKLLGLIIAEMLYMQFPNKNEGDLSKIFAYITSKDVLYLIAEELCLKDFIQFSGQIEHSIIVDTVEAIIASIYLDSNSIEPVKSFIIRYFQKHIDECISLNKHINYNPKSMLQEWAQQNKLPIPTYTDLYKTGEDHNPVFTVTVNVEGYNPVQGQGANKLTAQKEAAKNFINSNK